MNSRYRLLLFVPSALLLLALFAWSLRDMTPFGHYRGPYGDLVDGITVYERHVTDMVTAVNFDIRGVDTMIEESILFMSVAGVTLLLRKQKQEEDQEQEKESADPNKREAPPASDAVRTTTLALVGPLIVFGLYLILHGQLTPGGGFQGGVILATAPLLVYIAGDLKTFKRITSHFLVQFGEALGIAGYVMVGCLGLILGVEFMRNVIPVGTTGSVISGGTIFLLNIATGLAVAGGFVSATYSFLEQTVKRRIERAKQK